MAVTSTDRYGLPQWSSGADAPVTRLQLNSALLALDNLTAGWLTPDTAANRPAAATANAGFLFRATDTGAISLSTGGAWLPIPTGTFLALVGGQMAGALDMNSQELRGAVVLNARDKRKVHSAATGALTIDANDAGNHTIPHGAGNISGITVNNFDDGESLRLTFIQDGTGGRTIAFPGTWLWPGGGTATLAGIKTTANAVNVVVIEKVDTAVHAFLAADMKV